MENFMEIKPKLSFIDEENIRFKTVENLEELKKVVTKCRITNRILSNYDFSNLEDISCISFDQLILENIVFSRFRPCGKGTNNLFQLSFKGATLDKVSFAQANLQQCNFDAAKITCADFFFTKLEYCRFRQAIASYIDFRYSKIQNCTMGEFNVTLGDFYSCNFQGSTNFIKSLFTRCSFTCAIFEHACIRMDNLKDGIIQENSDCYHNEFLHKQELHWNRYNPCFSFSSMNHNTQGDKKKSEVFIAAESMNFYRQMSGIYAGKGLNRDSNKAYEKKVLEERKYCKLKLAMLREDTSKNNDEEHGKWHYRFRLFNTYITQTMGYGYKCLTPCFWFFILVFVFWVIFQCVDGTLSIDTESVEHLGYSLNNALSPFEKYYRVVNIFISALQSTLGILLVGFLGFVVANKIRNDS